VAHLGKAGGGHSQSGSIGNRQRKTPVSDSLNSSLYRDLLTRIQTGDEAALNELIERATNRLRRLTHKMLGGDFERLRRWEDTDDVFQNAVLRLCRALRESQPETRGQFFQLAALQIRRELHDLARHYFGPQGSGANRVSGIGLAEGTEPAAEGSCHDPANLVQWTEFHDHMQKLPVDERVVADLLWYHGMPQEEVAALLEINVRTVQRRWQRIRVKLHAVLRGLQPLNEP
jgi:RNA polymerase sigma factor (sigma-70 family)